MAVSEPRRRQADQRPPRPVPFGPTPGSWGPPDHEGFMRSLANALDTAGRARRPLTLVALDVSPGGAGDVEAAVAGVANLVRSMVRRSDGLWRDGSATLTLLLADVDGPNAEPVLARIRMRLRRVVPAQVRMGRAATTPGITAAALLELAQTDRRPIVVG